MINFENAKLLTYSHDSQFLGNVARYRVTKNLTIEAAIYDLTNSDGVSGIQTGIKTLLDSATDYSPVIINGITFGSGKIDSIDLAESNDVRIKNYTIALSIYDTGNLFNVQSGYYSGINYNDFNLVDTISESFNLTQDNPNTRSYQHSVSLRATSGINIEPIQIAKSIASGLFLATNITGFLLEYPSSSVKKYYTESYNLITNECNFVENAEYNLLSGNYSLTYTHSIETREDGISDITENGEILGLVKPKFSAAQSGLNEQLPLIFGRCSGVFDAYKPTDCYPLNTNIVSKQIGLNTFDGTITYGIQYTNDPRLNDLYSWEYTHKMDRSENNIYTVSENGIIAGFGKKFQDKYPHAISGYNVIIPNIPSRVSGFYATVYPSSPFPLHQIGKSEGRSELNGEISYGATYTDDITIYGLTGIKKLDIEYRDSSPTAKSTEFNILNVKQIIQPQDIANQGQRDLTLNIIGSRNWNINDYLGEARTLAVNYIPTGIGSDVYLNDCNYNFVKNDNKFSFSSSWMFYSGKAFDDLTIN